MASAASVVTMAGAKGLLGSAVRNEGLPVAADQPVSSHETLQAWRAHPSISLQGGRDVQTHVRPPRRPEPNDPLSTGHPAFARQPAAGEGMLRGKVLGRRPDDASVWVTAFAGRRSRLANPGT
jgi:hypothetical protein